LSPRDPRSQKIRDEYDGHADYRESFAPKPARVVARGFLRGLLAIGLCVTITWVVHKLLYPGPNILVIFTAGFAGLLGLIGGALGFSWMNEDRAGEQKELGFLDTIAVLIFVFAFAVPLSIERAHEKRERRARAAERDVADRAREEAVALRQGEGVAKLRRLGRFAEPGIVPPRFEVRDNGISVTVTFRGDVGTSISLSRVLPDPGSRGGWKGCALWTEGPHGEGHFYGHYINPGMTLHFEMYRECIEEFRGAALEFRVGEPTMEGDAGERAWWSESAFAWPEGREKETFERMAGASARRAEPVENVSMANRNAVATPNAMATPNEAAATASASASPAAEPLSTPRILRCRDASGAIHYTQAYCPPGTVQLTERARD
jgi:hypothetical protein